MKKKFGDINAGDHFIWLGDNKVYVKLRLFAEGYGLGHFPISLQATTEGEVVFTPNAASIYTGTVIHVPEKEEIVFLSDQRH